MTAFVAEARHRLDRHRRSKRDARASRRAAVRQVITGRAGDPASRGFSPEGRSTVPPDRPAMVRPVGSARHILGTTGREAAANTTVAGSPYHPSVFCEGRLTG